MSILITGGAGFIGTFTKNVLKEHGYKVILVDNYVTGDKNNIKNDDILVEKDIRDEGLYEELKDYQIDSIIHLAAQTSVPVSVDDPVYDVSENIEGTVKMLQLANRLYVKKFIFASSAAVYGENPSCPLRETEVLAPTSPYGLSKMTGEQYVQLLCKQYGIEATILRYANVFGPKQSNDGEGGVIKIFIDKLIKNERLQIYGDGGQTRDFIYVEDIASAHLAALNHSGGVYNVSTNTEISVNELVDVLTKLSNDSISKQYTEPRKGDIYRSCLDNSQITKALSWRPGYSFEEGLKKTYDAFIEK
ncbi:NAD-dependent epimerase/dehydratase family protein [Peribacillus cavernae]|uniref:NAD-dependent epimerase/dehydratase family protein n=1 Tax=Peribacillus cavernae TaxID=1674310 RepID=A0A433HSY7_9BACI|nr:NAD-dependent epimerase/dehydratase family protein [Peribacillus cavernae]MDQ0218440.1 UDP-glucose 4-epimerase [Peribacillus cavernae]RUQ31441.1 NAD-dependent epimerase/dehydratase family protein [Peribacillus cavernae]